MRIDKIHSIFNFRSLTGVEIEFNNNLNFIVGENNIGKTSVLDMLEIIFETGSFKENDFKSLNDPITADIEIAFEECERGYIDCFDPEGDKSMLIRVRQEHPDSRIEYFDRNDNYIKSSEVRKLSVFYYTSKEYKIQGDIFSKSNKKARVIKHVYEYIVRNSTYDVKDILNSENVNQIVNDVNQLIDKINLIEEDGVSVYNQDVAEEVILSLLKVGGKGVVLEKMGDGIEAVFNISLSILSKLVYLTETRGAEFNKCLVEAEGNMYFPMIILIDEPENHQHPFRQRNIINSINDIINNNNANFNSVLKTLFNVDGIIGQANFVTHSPYVLSDDYKQYIRINLKNNVINAICGKNIDLNEQQEKNLRSLFIEMKKAMFARKVILVEGPTDVGVVTGVLDLKNINLNAKMISVVPLGGADSVIYVSKLFRSFGIDTLALIDRDKECSFRDQSSEFNIFFTNYCDIENDVYQSGNFEGFLRYYEMISNEEQDGYIKIFKNEASFKIDKYMQGRKEYLKSFDNVIKEGWYKCMEEKLIQKWKSNKNYIHSELLVVVLDKIPSSIENVVEWCEND